MVGDNECHDVTDRVLIGPVCLQRKKKVVTRHL